MMNSPKLSGIYNCGTGTTHSFYEIAILIRDYFVKNGRSVDIKEIEMPKSMINSYQFYTKADLINLRRAGFSHKFKSLHEGVHDTIKQLHLK